MGEEGSAMGEIDHLSAHKTGRPRDLLRQLSAEVHHHHQHHHNSRAEESEGLELSLGLSLGGRFGVDPVRLVRSSSIAGLPRIPSYEDLGTLGVPPASPAITRTVSLPTETEEDRRKRKEMQCLRRMEAKRKRTEKQKNLGYRSVGKEEDRRGEEEGIKGKPNIPGTLNGFSPAVASPFGMPAGWGSGASVRGPTPPVDAINGKTGVGFNLGFVPSSQGSLGSQGSSSSGVSDFESRVNQGLNTNEARSPTSVQSLPAERAEQKLATEKSGGKSGKAGGEDQAVQGMVSNGVVGSKKPKVEENGVVREMGKSVMEEMPCVSTRGCGPNGRRIEGFLYRYRKGEEVRIVCVCHGNFLSPAEFVKHAGGGDVQYPLKHIVVNPSSFL